MLTIKGPNILEGLEPEAAGFVQGLLDRAGAIRVPELFASRHRDAIYWMPDRHGVTTIGLRTASLTRDQLIAIMTYRLAQYLMAHQLDPRMIYEHRLEHEPLSGVSDGDVHVIGAEAGSGEILCYATLKSVGAASTEQTLAAQNRALFPVEAVFGWGVFNRLRILPDLPVARIREIGRFAKSQYRDPLDELILRAPVEVGLGVMRLLRGVLMQDVDACIGDLEEGIGKKNFDFFHVPSVIVHGVVPFAEEGSFGFFNYQFRTRYPFALLCADIPRSRLDASDAALVRPGKEGIMAVLAMKAEPLTRSSGLEPATGLGALTDAPVPQEGVAMSARRKLLEASEWLRGTRLFQGLSVAEAAALATFIERGTVDSGTTIVRQGEPGDDLYLIESGTADVEVTTRSGGRVTMATLVPGDYFGEIALVTGGERTADVVAKTPMTLLRLSREAHQRYLAQMIEVETDLTRTALARTHATFRTIEGKEK